MEYQVSQDRPWFRFWPEGVLKQLDYPEIPLSGLLSRAVEKWPESIAFSFQERELSYRELDELTSRLAAGLHNMGVRTGDRILLFLANSLEFVIGYYGILKAGGIVTTASPLFRQAELTHELNDTVAAAIITSSDFYPLVKEVQAGTALKTIILTDTEKGDGVASLNQILNSSPPTPPKFAVKPKEDVAAIVYTGGTTGLPKGVLLTHYNLIANAIQNAAWF